MKPYRSLNETGLVRIARQRGYSNLAGISKQELVAVMEAYDRERSLWKGRSNYDLRKRVEAGGIDSARGMKHEKLLGLVMKNWVKGLCEETEDAVPLTQRVGPKEPLDQVAFEQRFYESGIVTDALDKRQPHSNIWSDASGSPSDMQLQSLAELYLDATASQRQQMRNCFDGSDTWPLLKFVRRVAERIYSRADTAWLRYGLAIASLENARMDYRDLIVSLVVLRFAAERAQIETSSFFNEIIGISDQKLRPMLENARDHAQSHVLNTVRAFGPSGWVVD